MAKQTINVGSSPDDGTGDNLRAGGVKINSNFDELYQLRDVTTVAAGNVGFSGSLAANGNPVSGYGFTSNTLPIAIIRTANDTSETNVIAMARGTGAGNLGILYTVGGGANDVTTVGVKIGSTGVLTVTASGLGIVGSITTNSFAKVGSYTVAGAASLGASTAGQGAIIYVSDEAGGAVLAFSDGTNWRRVTDRVIIS